MSLGLYWQTSDRNNTEVAEGLNKFEMESLADIKFHVYCYYFKVMCLQEKKNQEEKKGNFSTFDAMHCL